MDNVYGFECEFCIDVEWVYVDQVNVILIDVLVWLDLGCVECMFELGEIEMESDYGYGNLWVILIVSCEDVDCMNVNLENLFMYFVGLEEVDFVVLFFI